MKRAIAGARILAAHAVSAFGSGRAAWDAGQAGEPARVAIGPDEALLSLGLSHPRTARTKLARVPSEDRATTLLSAALCGCVRELDDREPAWRRARVGLAIGTSSGGMISMELLFAAMAGGRPVGAELARAASYYAPLERAIDDAGLDVQPRVQVLGACASSTLAIGLATRWLELGRCDLVLAGGYDAIATMVAAGFEVLRATTASLPRPFRSGRDGMALGEGAAVLALGPPRGPGLGFVSGFGASTDAVHITAPDRTGAGLARAAEDALADALLGARDVDLVSAHATATSFNDAAEARALGTVFGDGPIPPVVPTKAQIGHTLGAAGALESLAALDAMSRGLVPAAAGDGPMDPDCSGIRLLERAERGAPKITLKLAAAFGGVNAALVLGREPPVRPARAPRPVYLLSWAETDTVLSEDELAALGVRHPSLGRCDTLTRLALSAAARLGRVGAAGIVVGHALSNLETNAVFAARLREKGPLLVPPRLFPYTSPNAAAGECAIALGLTGPSFAVGASRDGWREALATAADLVAVGDADRMVVVAADDVGPASIALGAEAGFAPPPKGACAALIGVDGGQKRQTIPYSYAGDGATGHRAMAAFLRAL
jgi:3-oxoacyl-[acyl-carrier-protein] synthase II